jgi:hypothetical protein
MCTHKWYPLIGARVGERRQAVQPQTDDTLRLSEYRPPISDRAGRVDGMRHVPEADHAL